MKMVYKVGFTLDEAEIVRRCVGKKKVEEMKQWEQKIKDKITEQKLDPRIGEILWKIANDSANYQFNKSHSVAYAALAAISIYLKFKYPQQFFLSLFGANINVFEPYRLGGAKIALESKAKDFFESCIGACVNPVVEAFCGFLQRLVVMGDPKCFVP